MQVHRGIPEQADTAAVLTIGNFDGVHLGHQALLSLLTDKARALGLPAVVLTFEPHPRTLFWRYKSQRQRAVREGRFSIYSIETVAEGIENEVQVTTLLDLGCVAGPGGRAAGGAGLGGRADAISRRTGRDAARLAVEGPAAAGRIAAYSVNAVAASAGCAAATRRAVGQQGQ